MVGFVASPKVKMINVRLTPEVHEFFKIACDLRGVSMSSFLHQAVVRTIREEREREPKAFSSAGDGMRLRNIPHLGETVDERVKKRKTG